MPSIQTKITKFFKPAKLLDHQRLHNKRISQKSKTAQKTEKTSSPKPATKPATTYVPPHKRSTPSSHKPTPAKPTPKTQPSAKAKAAAPKLQPKPKPATTKAKKTEHPQQPAPRNQPILDHLAAHASPKFNFPKDQRPTFSALFPGTTRPKVTMLHGTPTIDKEIFASLLKVRIAAAHTVLRTAKLDRPRLPRSFVSSQIHLIQNSLRATKKTKKSQSPASKPETPASLKKKGKSTTLPTTTKAPEFVPAAIPTSDKPVVLSSEELRIAKMRSSDIQTPETESTHSLIHSIRDRRSLINLATLTGTIDDFDAFTKLTADASKALSLTSIPVTLVYVIPDDNTRSSNTRIIDLTSLQITVPGNTFSVSKDDSRHRCSYLPQLIAKIAQLVSLATQL